MHNKNLGFAGKIAKIFVENSRLSILLIITLFLWGILSFVITPKQYNPEIVAPAFNVIVEYPGAGSDEIYELVTKPLEDKILDIKGVDEVISQTIDGGAAIVTVKFFVGEDMEDSKIKLSQKVNGNMDLKPTGALDPIIKDIDPDNVPVLVAAFSSNTLSDVALRKLALDVRDKLKLVENTANVDIHGGQQEQILIELDPLELNAKNISVFEIYESLQNSNSKLLSGELKNSSRDNVLLEVDGSIEDVEDLRGLVLRSEGEHQVYLQDVAKVELRGEEKLSFVAYASRERTSQNTVFLSIAKKKGANITAVTDGVLAELEKLQNTHIPAGVDVAIVRNEGQTASEEVFGLVINLFQAIMIVSLILFFFLGGRAAFIVAIAIPLVLTSVFGAGYLAGQTINRITLFALILSLGLLVDNATVVVENAVRHIKNKKNNYSKVAPTTNFASSGGDVEVLDRGGNNADNRNAVIKAVDEVGMGLFMSTVTTLLAFFPMAFVGGMMGPYMGPIPFFVPVALVFSLLIAYSVNPFLSSFLLKNLPTAESSQRQPKKFSGLIKFVNSFKSRTINIYEKSLAKIFASKSLRKKVLIFSFLAFVLVLFLPLVGIVKFRMLPKADREQFYIYLDFPEGTSLQENKNVSDKLVDFLLQETEILSLQSFIGEAPVVDFNGLFKGSDSRKGSHYTTLKVNLTHHDDRKQKSEKLVQELRPRIYDFLGSADVNIKLIEDPPGPPVLSTVLLKIKGENYETLKEVSRDVEEMFKSSKEVVDTDSTRSEVQEKVSLKINYDKASRLGVTSEQIVQTMRIAVSGANISVIHNPENKEQEYVFMQFAPEYRQGFENLSQVYLSSRNGEKIPLLEMVDVQHETAEDILYADNREKTVYVNAEMGARGVTYAALDIYRKLFKYQLPDGQAELSKLSLWGVEYREPNGENLKIEWGGEWKLTLEVFRDLGAAMMVAVFLIYLVLVAQFKSFRVPLLIMITIPLAMIGVLPGFALLGATLGIYFNATSMIGVIALAGIVVNNAIILVEYLNSFKGKGIPVEEALIETGKTRMRPIVLTSLTTILGSLTIVADPVWAGLAWSIIFGISISTVLTLVIFPVLYYQFKAKEWN